jgi:hypothetical protein
MYQNQNYQTTAEGATPLEEAGQVSIPKDPNQDPNRVRVEVTEQLPRLGMLF